MLALDLRNLRRIEIPPSILIPDVITVESYINCIMVTIRSSHLEIVKFFLDDWRIDVHEAIKLSSSKSGASHSRNVENEAFCLFLCLTEEQLAVLKYLFLSRSYAFDKDHLLVCVRLCETLDREKFVPALIDSITSHEIFNSQGLEGKLEIVEFLLSDERKYQALYQKYVKKPQYNWAYWIVKGNNVHNLEKKEVKEVAQVANDIKDSEIEVPEKNNNPEKVDRVGSFIKKLAKLDEGEEKFDAFRTVTQKIIDHPN